MACSVQGRLLQFSASPTSYSVLTQTILQIPAQVLKSHKQLSYSQWWLLGGRKATWGINGQFRTVGSMCACHTHTWSGWGSKILASVTKWSTNIHSKFQVCSYYSLKVISIFKTQILDLCEITPQILPHIGNESLLKFALLYRNRMWTDSCT